MGDRRQQQTLDSLLESERSLLSCVMGGGLSPLELGLSDAHFVSPIHSIVWRSMISMACANSVIDIVTLSNHLAQCGELDRIGGSTTLMDIVGHAVGGVGAAKYYAGIVRDAATRRRLMLLSAEIGEMSRSSASSDDAIREASERIHALASDHNGKYALAGIRAEEAVIDAVRGIEATVKAKAIAEENGRRYDGVTGLRTGIAELDRMTTGLHGGELMIIASRPGMGKSALGAQIALHAATDGDDDGRVLFISLEMAASRIALRLIASGSGVSLGSLRNGSVAAAQWKDLSDATSRIAKSRLWFHSGAGYRMSNIRAMIRQMAAERGRLSLVVLDYLQLIGDRERDVREQEVAAISRALKMLSQELMIPFIALSQLNRAVESRVNKRPTLADLRESGAIEQDADIVLGIYREDVYAVDPADHTGEAELIILKHRDGELGTVRMRFDGSRARFTDDLSPRGQIW